MINVGAGGFVYVELLREAKNLLITCQILNHTVRCFQGTKHDQAARQDVLTFPGLESIGGQNECGQIGEQLEEPE